MNVECGRLAAAFRSSRETLTETQIQNTTGLRNEIAL